MVRTSTRAIPKTTDGYKGPGMDYSTGCPAERKGMKKSIKDVLLESEKLNIEKCININDVYKLIHSGKDIYGIVVDALCYGGVVGYRKAERDIKKR